MKKKASHLFPIFLLIIGINSCGVFIQNNGIKNYQLEEKLANSKELNDYQYDFLYLDKLLVEGFPNLNRIFPDTERENQKAKILASLSQDHTNDQDFLFHSRRYLSNVHNQHTTINLKTEPENIYPYIIHIEHDNWFLYSIDKSQDSLFIGQKIEKINDVPTNEIEEQLIQFTFGENKINQQFELRKQQLYNQPYYLKAIGVTEDLTQALQLTFSDHSALKLMTTNPESVNWYKTRVPSDEITRWKDETYFYKIYPEQDFGYLQFNKCHDKIEILESIESYVKPWLRPMAKGYVKRQFKKENPAEQIAYYYNKDYPIFKDFIWEFVDSLNSSRINHLIIDLRNNPGGNLTLGAQLIYFLTASSGVKGLTEYVYTSDLSEHYFTDIYEELNKQDPNGLAKKQLVVTEYPDSLFSDVLDSASAYYISPNRPVYKGKVFVLSNYRTGSAAALLTTLLQDNEIGTVIGTSVGNNPTGATGYTPLKLPKTKADISIATFYQERPQKDMGEIQIPDYWVEYTMKDLATGRDPYLDKVNELINNN